MKSELIISILLLILLLVFLNPLNIFMPPPVAMTLIIVFILIFAIFTATIWKGKPRDEREYLLYMIAGRFAFLAGTGALVIGIVLQEFSHTLDPWLVYALMAMIFGKIIGLLYGQRKY